MFSKIESWDVVIWTKENKCDYVPSSWRVNGKTNMYLWPIKLSASRIKKMITICEEPNFNVTYSENPAICKATVADLKIAEDMVIKLQYTNSLTSSTDDNDEQDDELHFESDSEPPVPTETGNNTTSDFTLLQCHNCEKIESVSKLLKAVGTIQYDIKQLKTTISEINDNIALLGKPSLQLQELPEQMKLPIDSEERLNEFEIKLEEPSFYKTMTTLLSLASGSSDIRKVVHSVVRKLLSKTICLQYSALGRKGKKKFSKLKSFQLVRDATRKIITSARDDEIQTHFSTALAQAGDRDGGRQSRKTNNDTASTIDEEHNN